MIADLIGTFGGWSIDEKAPYWWIEQKLAFDSDWKLLPEKAWFDKFIDKYMGKFYKDGATEILSMGLQMFYTNPVALAKQDPEYFDFIYSVVRMGNI